jgi:hypothetical protein
VEVQPDKSAAAAIAADNSGVTRRLILTVLATRGTRTRGPFTAGRPRGLPVGLRGPTVTGLPFGRPVGLRGPVVTGRPRGREASTSANSSETIASAAGVAALHRLRSFLISLSVMATSFSTHQLVGTL